MTQRRAQLSLGAPPGLFLALALLAAASGCGPSPGAEQAPAPPPAGRLEIRQPRALLTPGMGAVYFTVVNPGPRSDRLLRVDTAAARLAETHESVDDNGVMRMVPHPDGFAVPARGTLELQPGGKHVMLVEPRPGSSEAGRILLTLHFEHAGAIEVRAAVLGGKGGGH